MEKKYGKFDRTGKPIGFYSTETHGPRTIVVEKFKESDIDGNPVFEEVEENNPNCKIPVDAREISDKDWQDYLTGKWLCVEGVKTPVPEIPAEDPAVVEARLSLIQSDKQMARVTEDLVALLITKNILKKTDLPEEVSSVLDLRKEARLKIR